MTFDCELMKAIQMALVMFCVASMVGCATRNAGSIRIEARVTQYVPDKLPCWHEGQICGSHDAIHLIVEAPKHLAERELIIWCSPQAVGSPWRGVGNLCQFELAKRCFQNRVPWIGDVGEPIVVLGKK